MPKGFPPAAFVSSTCYDLSQLRADLKDFLSSLGFEPLLSEISSFPVNPQATTIENCVNAVKERADVFILVVGARYGSIDTSGRSVTNLEYLAAKAKGIPIYVFVSKPIINGLAFWRNNPGADFKGIVDTPQLFTFVEQLRGSQEHWVYGFEYANEIKEILREQFAYLFMDALVCRGQLRGAHLPEYVLGLTGTCLKYVFEKPIGWEYYLFAHVLGDEMARLKHLKRDLIYGLKIGRTKRFGEPREVFDWIALKGREIRLLVGSAETLLNVAIHEALGPQGSPGDPEHIVYVARRLAHIYKALLEWTIDFNLVDAESAFERILQLYAKFSDVVIAEFEGMPIRIITEIDKAVVADRRGDTYIADMRFTFGVPDTTELHEEFQRLGRVFGT